MVRTIPRSIGQFSNTIGAKCTIVLDGFSHSIGHMFQYYWNIPHTMEHFFPILLDHVGGPSPIVWDPTFNSIGQRFQYYGINKPRVFPYYWKWDPILLEVGSHTIGEGTPT
jgi:hypothetical protein